VNFHRVLNWQSTAPRLSQHETLNPMIGQVEVGAAMQATEIQFAVSRRLAWSGSVDA